MTINNNTATRVELTSMIKTKAMTICYKIGIMMTSIISKSLKSSQKTTTTNTQKFLKRPNQGSIKESCRVMKMIDHRLAVRKMQNQLPAFRILTTNLISPAEKATRITLLLRVERKTIKRRTQRAKKPMLRITEEMF